MSCVSQTSPFAIWPVLPEINDVVRKFLSVVCCYPRHHPNQGRLAGRDSPDLRDALLPSPRDRHMLVSQRPRAMRQLGPVVSLLRCHDAGPPCPPGEPTRHPPAITRMATRGRSAARKGAAPCDPAPIRLDVHGTQQVTAGESTTGMLSLGAWPADARLLTARGGKPATAQEGWRRHE